MPNALIIDDNQDSADSLVRMLDLLGLHTQVAYGPRDAMMMLPECAPDVIFLDVHMQGVDGFEMLAYLRRLPTLADVPVVFITLDDRPETIERMRQSGMLRVLFKPTSVEVLEKTLQSAGLM